jgi:acyl-CoA synthetase (AMP-forming)/AMP-acid ligase II
VNLLLLLDMVASAGGDEAALTEAGGDSLSAAELLGAAWGGAAVLDGAPALVHLGTNGLAPAVGLFASAAAGVPFVPVNYRLSDDQLDDLLAPFADALVVAEGSTAARLAADGFRVLDPADFLAAARAGATTGDVPYDVDSPAILLHTSGTTAAPKAAVLRHRHLASYVIGTVEFLGAGPGEAVLVSVPPYHVAGVANLLSNLYLGRRIVYLPQFEASEWVRAAREQGITNAMVVPTMLARICDVLEGEGAADGGGLPSLRALSYGGARTPATLLERVMALLPDVDLTNAYGLTETSSTIAVLGPDDHRAAAAGDPDAKARLSSAGRILPSVEVEVRDADGAVLAPGEPGLIWVRGEQVSGEYRGTGSVVDDDGWFPTRDRGWVDEGGYLFVEGRDDDTIIRGGENVAPAEIEEVLLRHPAVKECAVVGVPDDEWGQRIAAVVVCHQGAGAEAAELQDFVRGALRGSKTPDVVTFVDALPYTETGKLLRRVVLTDVLTAG